MSETSDAIKEVITRLESRQTNELLAMNSKELSQDCLWEWVETKSIEWNTYQFFCTLELYKRRARRWEEHHHGACCVVERVRNQYLLPRIRAFLAELKKRQENKKS
jgi:hypothetical protein